MHTAPAFQALDIYLATDLSRPIVADLMPDSVSEAVTLEAGSTSFVIPNANADPTDGQAVAGREFSGQIIREGRDVFVVLYVDRTSGEALLQTSTFEDNLTEPTPGTGLYRFYHLDATFSEGSVQFWDANDNRSVDELVRATFAIDPQPTDDQALPLGEYIVGVSQAGRDEPELIFDLDVLQDSFRVFLTPQGSNSRLLLINSNYQVSTVDQMPYMGPGEGQMSFVHLADQADPVDVYLVPSSGELPEVSDVTNLMKGSSSGLRTVVADTYEIRVFGNGDDPTGTPLVALEDVTLEDGQTRLVAIYDENGGAAIRALSPETTGGLEAGQFRYRVVHLDRALMGVDVLNATNQDMPMMIDPSFSDLEFANTTDYVVPNVPASTLNLGVDADDRDDLEVVYNIPDIQEGDILNIFLDRGVDSMGELTDPVAVIVPLNRTSYSQNGATIPDPSFVRLMHVSPSSPVSKLFTGTTPVMGQDNIGFGQSGSMYSEVEAGTELASITDTNETSATGAYARQTLQFDVDQRHTVVVYGRNPSGGPTDRADVAILEDDSSPPTAGRCRMRIFHGGRQAAGPLPPAILSASPGSINFGQVQYGEVSIDVELDAAPAGDTTVRATIGANQFSFEMPELVAGRIYTAYLVNDFFESPAIVSLVLQDQDGNTQTILRQGEIRLAHFLSFPGMADEATLELTDQNGMAVSLTAADGTSATQIGPIPFSAYSGPFALDEGSYTATLEIDGQPLITGQQIRVLADEVVTLGAVGDATVTTPGPSLTEVVEAPPASAPANELDWRFVHGISEIRQGGMAVNAVDVYDLVMNPNMPAAASLTFGGGASAEVRAPASSFQLGVDYDQDATEFEQTFNVVGLSDTKTYTLFFAQDGFLGRSMNPANDRAPLALFAIDNDIEPNGGSAIRIGADAELSFFHLAAGGGPVDVFANNVMNPVATNIAFQSNSNQRLVVAGTRDTAIALSATGDPLGDAFLTFTDPVFGGQSHTAVAYLDTSGAVQGSIFENQPFGMRMPSDYRIRIIHSAGSLGDVDLIDVDAGMPISSGATPGSATGWLVESSAETFRLGIDLLATNTSLPAMTNDVDIAFDLQGLIPGADYNLLLVADPTTGSVSGVLERLDSETLQATPVAPLARVRLANFSGQNPSAELYAGNVNVGSDGFAGSPNGPFPFEGASDWAFVQTGPVTIEAVTQGQMPGAGTIASVNTTLEPGGTYTYVLGETGVGPFTPVLVESESTIFGFGTDTRLTAVHAAPGVPAVDVYDNGNPASPVLLFDDLAPGTATSGSVDVPSGTVFDAGVDLDMMPPQVDAIATFSPSDLSPGMFSILIAFDLGGLQYQAAILRGDGSFNFVPLQ